MPREIQAWDLWHPSQQKQFNPDGSLKDRERRIEAGQWWQVHMLERPMKLEVETFEEMTKLLKDRNGSSYGEWLLSSSKTKVSSAQLKRDILNGEEISSLGSDVDPDDYERISHRY